MNSSVEFLGRCYSEYMSTLFKGGSPFSRKCRAIDFFRSLSTDLYLIAAIQSEREKSIARYFTLNGNPLQLLKNCLRWNSNPRPSVCQSNALPTGPTIRTNLNQPFEITIQINQWNRLDPLPTILIKHTNCDFYLNFT